MRVKIVGSGRVGAPLGAWFLQKGIKVSFSDINEELLKNVYEGWLDWEEPGLNAALREGRSNMLDPDDENCDWTFITVGTPVDKDGSPILHHLEGVVREHYQNSNIVLRSTVAPGTCDKLAERFNTTIWHAPERLLLGNGMDELDELPQIVGSTGENGSHVLSNQEFQRAFNTIFPAFRFGTAIEAECAKVSNNIVRYIEFATGTQLAEQFAMLGANPQRVREMMIDGYKRGRLAFPSFVGSYCLNKDWYMLANATGKTPTLASAAAVYNTTLPSKLIGEHQFDWTGKTVLICGLTYKPNLDDCRDTPSTAIYYETLDNNPDKILYHDPIVKVQEVFETQFPEIPRQFEVVDNIEDVLHEVDVLIIATAHDDYTALTYNDLKDGSIIIDPAYVVNRKVSDTGFVVEV